MVKRDSNWAFKTAYLALAPSLAPKARCRSRFRSLGSGVEQEQPTPNPGASPNPTEGNISRDIYCVNITYILFQTQLFRSQPSRDKDYRFLDEPLDLYDGVFTTLTTFPGHIGYSIDSLICSRTFSFGSK